MRRMISPCEHSLEVFRKDLWKDQRTLEKTTRNGEPCLVKYYISEEEASHEISVLKELATGLQIARVPAVLEEGSTYALMPYLSGIRVFNLFVELDRLEPPLDVVGREVKQLILQRCEANQKEIQVALLQWSQHSHPRPYPAQKITTIIGLLADCLGIEISPDSLNSEINLLCEILTKGSTVPFRDATTKNMVLASPQLWLGEFKSEDERRSFLFESLHGDSRPDWLDGQIVDFDFASCINSTTPEDDVVSLRFHERSWTGMPKNENELVWFGEPDPQRAAITFFVRYYRFGGRKAAYRLLHPSGHRVRFRHDNDLFYFERAPSVMKHLWAESAIQFSELMRFTDIVAKCLQVPLSPFDYFRAKYGKPISHRQYYVDMFPE